MDKEVEAIINRLLNREAWTCAVLNSDVLSDLLCDLMHWCDSQDETDFERELETARKRYSEET